MVKDGVRVSSVYESVVSPRSGMENRLAVEQSVAAQIVVLSSYFQTVMVSTYASQLLDEQFLHMILKYCTLPFGT